MTKLGGAVLAAALLMLAGCGGGEAASSGKATPKTPQATVLEGAEKACGARLKVLFDERFLDKAQVSDFLVGGDEGKTLTVSTSYSENRQTGFITPEFTFKTMMCVLRASDAPDAVQNEVKSTNALMGRQEASWDKIKVAYSFHPDSGVNAVFTEE